MSSLPGQAGFFRAPSIQHPSGRFGGDDPGPRRRQAYWGDFHSSTIPYPRSSPSRRRGGPNEGTISFRIGGELSQRLLTALGDEKLVFDTGRDEAWDEAIKHRTPDL